MRVTVTGPYSSNKTSSGADPSTRPTPGRQNYLAILVTTPPVHEYGPASERLYSTAPGRPGPISWVSTETDSIPPMLVSLVFRRHFAICLVAEAAWRSTTTTLQEKLAGQLFWDHCGDGEGSPGSRASTWTPGRIGQINALQVLGLVVADEDAAEICTSCELLQFNSRNLPNGPSSSPFTDNVAVHMKLKRIWGEYRNIWWNDADFALALGYLLVNDSVASVCRDIMQRRNELRTEVTELRRPARMMTNLANLGLSVGTVMLTTTVLAASPVAWPLGASAIWVSLWHAEQVQEQEQWQRRREACARLEEEFPGLQQLFV